MSEWPKCLYFVWLLLFHSVSLSGQKRADGVSHTASVNIVNDEYSIPFGLSTLDGWVDFFSLCSFFNGSIIHSMARKFQNSVNEPPTTFQWNSFHHHHHRHQYNYILFAWHFLCVGRCFFPKNAAHSLPKTVTFFPRTSIVILLQCQLSHFSFVKRTKWMSMILATKFNATSKREIFFLSFSFLQLLIEGAFCCWFFIWQMNLR